jgi:LmbE family N-acetylglucosaminyl deacetylase
MADVLVLSPHLDDAVLSCWHLLDSIDDVLVVNVFTGLPPAGTPVTRWDRITGATDARVRVEERLREDREALGLVRKESVGLDFVEGQYGARHPSPQEIAAAVEPLEGHVVAPAGIGGHSEHELVRDAALRLGRTTSFYADLPYATAFGWPAWVPGVERDAYLDVDADWEEWIAPLPATGYEPRVVELSDEQQLRKIAAMRTYRTQFPALEAGAARRLTHPDLIAFELIWDPSPGARREGGRI